MIELAAALLYTIIAYYTFVSVCKAREKMIQLKMVEEIELSVNVLKFLAAIWPIYYTITIVGLMLGLYKIK